MAEAAISNTGQATASSSSSATLSITRLEAIVWKVAVAIALPKTSCAQVTTDLGVTITWLEIKRSSRLSRGRSIKRWGQRVTGLLKQ
jgi:hypothetical protein